MCVERVVYCSITVVHLCVERIVDQYMCVLWERWGVVWKREAEGCGGMRKEVR